MEALTEIFKKVLGSFDFRIWKWSSRAPKIKFLQYVNSRGLKNFSRIAMALILFQRKLTIWIFQICKNWSPSATILYWLKKVQLQLYSSFESIFGSRTSGVPKKLHLCMSKSARESSCSIQSFKMRFWMIFKLIGSKNMDF